MHILIETGDYDLTNLGDVSMLQVAESRLRGLWPRATIEIVTRSPARLARFCPYARPLLLHAAPSWYKQSIRARLYAALPSVLWTTLTQADRVGREVLPALGHLIDLGSASLHGDKNHFLQADLVVAAGGGYIADSFAIPALLVLDTLGIAARLGTPIALLGQGLGPCEHPALSALARQVLARAELIALRERRFSEPLLHTFGVSAERIMVTGDESICLAYEARRPSLGQGIGVNVRIAAYAEVNPSLLAIVRDTLLAAAQTYNAPLLPVPIALGRIDQIAFETQNDLQSIQFLIGEQKGASHQFENPAQVIAQVAECRLVVTGSYHGAVFALAQGIPTICLANSTYYTHKFLGLADQFDTGCEVLFLNDAKIGVTLADAIARLWQSAESLRPQLLAAAQRQVTAGQQAYERLFQLVSARR